MQVFRDDHHYRPSYAETLETLAQAQGQEILLLLPRVEIPETVGRGGSGEFPADLERLRIHRAVSLVESAVASRAGCYGSRIGSPPVASPESNKIYNKADAIIVQQGAMKDQLIGLGVDPSKIEIVPHGTDLPAMDENQPREGIIFYGGHHPLKGKGLHAVFKAMALLKTRLGPKAPKLKVHGYFSADDLAAVKELAAQSGLENDIAWLSRFPCRKSSASTGLRCCACCPLWEVSRDLPRPPPLPWDCP